MDRNEEYREGLLKRLGMKELSESYFFPKYLAIETCNNCNARCIMCPKGKKGTSSMQMMDKGLFDKILEEISFYADWVEMICLNSDGEPLLDQEIAQKIRRLKGIGVKHVNISTNGQLLTRHKIRELLESGLDDIRISLDGFTRETFEKVRRGLQYDVVKENILNLIEMRDETGSKMEIRLRMVELEENGNEREAWMEYWKKILQTTDKVQLMPMHTWSGKIAEETQQKIDYYAGRPCISVFSSFAINYDGMVQLCDSDVEQKVIMGDVAKHSIREIWQGEKFNLAREWHVSGQRNMIEICRGCDHWDRKFKEIGNAEQQSGCKKEGARED